MWNFASNCLAGSVGSKSSSKTAQVAAVSESSDDETSSVVSREEEGLECPICWESFNIVENVPYVLWCGHTLCKNCIFGLQWAVVKFPTLPVQLPLFISCPWCNVLSFRLVYRGNLKFPRKNYFLLWMVESKNDNRCQTRASRFEDHPNVWSPMNQDDRHTVSRSEHNHHSRRLRTDHDHDDDHNVGRVNFSLQKSLVFFVHLTSKFPLVIIFLLIILYAIPASFAILALYVLITVLFAIPSLLILYFAYPSLDWLVREIIT
ncbi:hypothetical protein LINGRAHAP2_LOCUS34113 [Linum grandiflorum]